MKLENKLKKWSLAKWKKKLESEIEKLGTPIEMEDLKGQIKDKHHYVRVKHVNALLMKRTQDIKNRLL